MKTRHRVFKWLMVIALLAGLTQAVSPTVVSGQDLDDEKGCTTVIVGKEASADGSVLMAHTEDYGANDAMKLVYHPRQTHEPGEVIHFAFEDVPQVPETYAYTSDDMYDPERLGIPPAVFLDGINEWGVSATSNCITSRIPKLPQDNTKGLGWPEIAQLVMERATTAREAVDLATSLVDQYTFNGFEATSCKELTFLIADPNEGWAIDVLRNYWVALRVPDDGALYYANVCRIGSVFTMASSNLIPDAIANGWYDPNSGTPFSFKDTYCAGYLNSTSSVRRQARAEFLLKDKVAAHTVTVQDLMAVQRDHYEGTPDYKIPNVPQTISNSGTQSGQIYHLRGWLPREFGPVMLITASSPDISIFTPVYAGHSEQTPVEWRTAAVSFSPDSAWWNFEYIQRTLTPRYALTAPAPNAAFYLAYFPELRAEFDRVEQQQFHEMDQKEQAAAGLIAQGKIDQAKHLLSMFSNSSLHQNYVNAKTELNWLFVKGGTPGTQ